MTSEDEFVNYDFEEDVLTTQGQNVDSSIDFLKTFIKKKTVPYAVNSSTNFETASTQTATETPRFLSEEELVKIFKNGARRVDLGSGNSREAGWVSVDNNPHTSPQLTMNAHELEFPDDCLNDVRMINSLGCMEDPQLVLKEVWRVLKPQGRLYITEPGPGSDDQLKAFVKHGFFRDFWEKVVRVEPYNYIPARAQGKWTLEKFEEEYNHKVKQAQERILWKLKIDIDASVQMFRNLVRCQNVVLRKETR